MGRRYSSFASQQKTQTEDVDMRNKRAKQLRRQFSSFYTGENRLFYIDDCKRLVPVEGRIPEQVQLLNPRMNAWRQYKHK